MADGDQKAGKPLFADPFEELEGSLLDECTQEEAPLEAKGLSTRDGELEPGTALAEEHGPARLRATKPVPAPDHEGLSVNPAAAQELDPVDDFLETLIADIDSDVARTFGSGVMPAPGDEVRPEERAAEQYVVFSMAGTDYAAHIDNLTEIGELQKITPVPNVPDWVLGVANLRGEILSMVDLAGFFGIEGMKRERNARMLVAKTSAEDLTLGLIVERVEGIRSLGPDQMVRQGAPLNDRVTPYLAGVCEENGRLVGILDFDRVLHSELMRRI